MELVISIDKNCELGCDGTEFSMAEAMEENPTSSGFTAREILNLPIEPIENTSISMNRTNLQTAEMSDSPPIFQGESSVTKSGQMKIDKFFGERNAEGTMVINVPEKTTLNVVCFPTGFYTTPEDVDKVARSENQCFSTANRSTRCKNNGAKLVQRALQFGDAGSGHGAEIRLSASETSNQSKLPFPCRKRKAVHPIPGKQSQAPSNGEQLSGTFKMTVFNHGTTVVGNNNKICIKEENGRDPRAEQVEVDGNSSPSSFGPEKSLKVVADEKYEKFMIIFHDLTNCLHPLRDKGKFEDFYSAAEDIAGTHSSEQHIQIIIIIERSVARCYQKDFEQSEKLINKALEMISKPGVEMKNFLLAYSHCHLTGLRRRQNKLTKANDSISTAKQNEEFIPFCIARVFLVYEHASNLTKQLSITNVSEHEPWLIMKEEAEKSLKECISLSERILVENSFFYLQRHLFCLVKLALMNLNCRTETSRKQPVDEDSIHEAERCIRRMEECEGDINEALSIQLYVAKCDLCFRKNNFHEAKRFAEQALEIATTKNFKLEIKPIQQRVNDIDKAMYLT